MKFFANAYTKSGIPDILCCCKGCFIGIEVKAPNGEPSELQKRNINKINKCGGVGVVLYPDQFDLFKELIWYLKLGDSFFVKLLADKINERWAK